MNEENKMQYNEFAEKIVDVVKNAVIGKIETLIYVRVAMQLATDNKIEYTVLEQLADKLELLIKAMTTNPLLPDTDKWHELDNQIEQLFKTFKSVWEK